MYHFFQNFSMTIIRIYKFFKISILLTNKYYGGSNMKWKLLSLLLIFNNSIFLGSSKNKILEIKNCNISPFRMCDYQNNIGNYFLGNSIYELSTNCFALNQSLILNKPESNHLTIVLEFEQNLSQINIDEIEINCVLSDLNLSDDLFKMNNIYQSIEEFTNDKSPFYDYSIHHNQVYIQYNITSLSRNIFVLNGSDLESYFYLKINSKAHLKLLRFMMNDYYLSCDEYYRNYQFKNHSVGDYINSSKVYYHNDSFHLVSEIENPLTLKEIVSQIKSYDYQDQKQIDLEVKDLGYQDAISNHQIGTYYVDLSAKNSYGEKSILHLILTLKDLTPPVISGKTGDIIRIPLSECGEINNVVYLDNYVKICDNIDQNLHLDSSYNYFIFHSLGKQKTILSATDLSGNMTKQDLIIEVYDDIPPTIEGKTKLIVYPYQYQNSKDILDNYFKINDNVELTKTEIIDDTYSSNISKNGKYQFTIKATDSNNNVSKQIVEVIIDQLSNPVFFINEVDLKLKSTNKYLSAEEMINLLVSENKIKQKKYQIVEYCEDTYNLNYQTSGEYQITIACYDQDYKKEYIKVLLTIEEDSKKDDSSFIVRIINFFKKIFRAISQFFSRIKKFFLSLFHR